MTARQKLSPLLVVRDAPSAIDFYVRAFGATEVVRYMNNVTGTVSHADLVVDGATMSITEEARAWNSDAPPSLGGSPVVLNVDVDDVEAIFARATTEGATVVFPLQEFCGEKMCRLRDPFGHLWLFRQVIEVLTPEEIQRRRDALFATLAAAAHSDSANEAHVSTISDDICMRSATCLARLLREKKLSSVELTQYFIQRIERDAERVNAVVVRDFERALAAAKIADDARARGERLGPLHGVPITLKEAFAIAGLATTWGVPAFTGNVAKRDSVVAARLRAAGAHFLGKTNVPTFLADFQTSNALFGRTNNPCDATRSSGGSSGGSAAALAAGHTALDCGSDIGGSIRNPAHYCGVFGHKPTAGIIPMGGHELPGVPQDPDMAVVGPLARCAEDLALALDVLVGSDERDASGRRIELPPPRSTTLAGLRVAVWHDDPLAPVDREIADAVERTAAELARHGAIVSEHARPEFEPAAYRRTYVALVGAVTGAASPDALYEAHRQSALAFDPADVSNPAAYARALVLDHRSWLRHDAERKRLRDVWRSFFQSWDVLLSPIMATVAFPHDDRPLERRTVSVNGEPRPYFEQVFWASLATLCYLPSTVFPADRSKRGLPIGLQVIGAEYADRTTIEVTRLATRALAR